MNRIEANKLLDKAREGHRYTLEEISAALYASGDLHDRVRSEGMEAALCPESPIFGQGESSELVAASQSRHSSDSWPGWSRYLDRRNEQATT